MRPYSQVSSIYVDSSVTLLGSFAMWTAFPSPDYYNPSAPFERLQSTTNLPFAQLDAGQIGAARMVIAVGTVLADGPPHRSQRALLMHWAPASGTNVEPRFGKWVLDISWREPLIRETVHALPVQATALATTP